MQNTIIQVISYQFIPYNPLKGSKTVGLNQGKGLLRTPFWKPKEKYEQLTINRGDSKIHGPDWGKRQGNPGF